jgi:N-acetylglucosaminyl-diphospho-decaprenol L-rhamnosyltransferase
VVDREPEHHHIPLGAREPRRAIQREDNVSERDDTIRLGDDAAHIAVVIVTFNSARVLEGCLRSLTAQSGVHLSAVVVADNASRDESVAIADSATDLPIRAVQLGRNAGYAAAINAGIATLDLRKLDAVFVMNPDCRLRPETLHQLAQVLRQPGRAIAVPRLVNPDSSLQPSLRRNPTVGRALAEAVIGGHLAGRVGTLGELVVSPGEYDHPGQVAWATGAAMLLSADAMRELGPWDESFLLYSEETEYCLRAADQGWTLWYEPVAVVEHIGGESDTNPMLYALMVANKVLLFRRRRSAPVWWAYYLAVVLGEAIRAVAGRRTSRASLLTLLRPSRRRTLIASITGGPA